jgi:hypothetical protein
VIPTYRNLLGTAAVLVVRAGALAAQSPTSMPDSAALTAASQAGAAAGARASVSGPRWASAAATVIFTPLFGGVGALVVAAMPLGGEVPGAGVARPGYPADSATAQRYRKAYRAAYLPRRRRAMQQAVLVGTGVFVYLLAAIARAY